MSKWTETMDNMGDALQVKQVTESLKQRVSATIVSDVLPHIEDAVNRFTATIQVQAKEEHGWCYWRDAIVLPTVMQGAVWLVKMVLTKTLTPTEQA